MCPRRGFERVGPVSGGGDQGEVTVGQEDVAPAGGHSGMNAGHGGASPRPSSPLGLGAAGTNGIRDCPMTGAPKGPSCRSRLDS